MIYIEYYVSMSQTGKLKWTHLLLDVLAELVVNLKLLLELLKLFLLELTALDGLV